MISCPLHVGVGGVHCLAGHAWMWKKRPEDMEGLAGSSDGLPNDETSGDEEPGCCCGGCWC